MRQLCVMFLLLWAASLLLASASIEMVNMENHGTAVSRVVIGLSGESGTEINSSNSGVQVLIKDYLPSQARINYKAGGLISGVYQQENLVKIDVDGAFRLEHLRLDNRIVIDIFAARPSKAQRLIIADFYSSVGKLNSADKTYGDLHIDYREDSQILYNWAQLLHKRGSTRATEKLAMIPQNSPYYSKAQQLMAMIHGDEEPLPPPPDAKDFSSMESETVVPDTVLPDTVQVIPAREVTASQPSRKKRIFYPGWLLPIALLVMGGLLAYLAFTRTPKRRPAVKKPTPSIVASEAALDSKTMCRMVGKLTSDGWTRKEIARELKISQAEVEQYLHLCHRGGHDDPEV